MFKWSGPPNLAPHVTATEVHTCKLPADTSKLPAKGYRTQRVLRSPTTFLKRLQAHLTTLPAGAGYAPHKDRHDVAIIVLSGFVESCGHTATKGGVFFFPAGEAHDMKNAGDGEAKYLVFEFHGASPDFHREPDNGKSFARMQARKQRKRKSRRDPWLQMLKRLLARSHH